MIAYKRIQGLLVLVIGVLFEAISGQAIDDAQLAQVGEWVGQTMMAVGVLWNLYGQAVARGPIKARGPHG